MIYIFLNKGTTFHILSCRWAVRILFNWANDPAILNYKFISIRCITLEIDNLHAWLPSDLTASSSFIRMPSGTSPSSHSHTAQASLAHWPSHIQNSSKYDTCLTLDIFRCPQTLFIPERTWSIQIHAKVSKICPEDVSEWARLTKFKQAFAFHVQCKIKIAILTAQSDSWGLERSTR